MISYEPLRILLVKEKMNIQELRDNNVLNPNTSNTLKNDKGYVNLSTIDKVCNYLSDRLGRPIKIDEIIEFIPDEADPAGE